MGKYLKTVFFLFLLSLSICQARDVKWNVYVDERQELSAIVWRLAGCEEYNGPLIPQYKADIENCFGQFREHPVMKFIREMRDVPEGSDAVSYNSVPTAAGLLCIRDGRLYLNEKVELDDYIERHDPRWTVDNIRKYAGLMDDFYRESGFHNFFTAHRELYDKIVTSMEKVLVKYVKPQWFENFYGEPFPKLSVCVSPAYGWNNFGRSWCDPFISPDAIDILIGVSRGSSAKSIAGSAGVIIHEISHSFSNQVLRDYDETFLLAGEKIFKHLSVMLTAAGYGAPGIIAGEYLNELFSMVYMKDMLDDDLFMAIRNCYKKGFLWADQGVRLMDEFSGNRDLYPTISEFMPQLAVFMTRVSDQIEEINAAYSRQPFVESIFPEPGSTVPDGIREIVIRFSEPMQTGITALDVVEGVECIQGSDKDLRRNGVNPRRAIRWADSRTLVYKIGVPLKKGKKYGFIVKKEYALNAFRNMPLKEDIRVTFKVN